MASSAGKTSRERVAAHRAKMREQGMRLAQRWVHDTRSPAFLAEARRQSRSIAASPTEAEDQAFVDALADWSDD